MITFTELQGVSMILTYSKRFFSNIEVQNLVSPMLFVEQLVNHERQ